MSRTVKHQYDSFYGRPKALEYPNGLTLKYSYNDYGYLEQTSNAASGYLYRQVTAMDEAGHITGADLANRVMSESRSYYSEGTMASVQVDGPLGRIHAHYYDGYDEFMNLTSERDGVTGLTKSYRYDTLNRLTEYQFSNTNPTFSATVNYAYDKVGNFLKKTDYSANSSTAYRYGGSACGYKPNAVCQLDKLNGTTVSFQYDNRGNLRVGDGLTMTYNVMDKPLSVSGRGATTSFVYGSDNMRAKQSRTVGSTTTTTYYVDKYYEADSDGSWRAYLDDIAVLSYTSQRGHLLQFTLKDRLGSATTLADQNGNIVSQRYFDPFGRTASTGGGHRTDIVNKNTLQSKLQDLDVTNKNRRGFTDHEHLNEQQLIHMNGRIYDYNLGRFMSVDPFIQAPTSTQSINPYSYIMNNPMSGIDPTGYCSTDDTLKGCADGLEAGKTQAITNADGKTVGHIGKDSQGNVHISNGSSKGQAAVANSIANVSKTADIGSQQQIASKGNDPLLNNMKDYAINNPYKTKSKDSYSTIPEDKSNLDDNIVSYNMVTLHHSGYATTPAEVENIHRANEGALTLLRQVGDLVGLAQSYDYADVGYHFMISEDGTIFEGRSLDYAGAHVNGHNQGNVGIVFLGDYSSRQLSNDQVGAARQLIGQLKQRYSMKGDFIRTHGEFNSDKKNELMGASAQVNWLRKELK